ncbi:HD domain-containing protein [uncultured Amnibacterium sp.]|uniref:HD domain-containing protein n=1 Tax=uncultured Amnibacterium sp. TaxID=1631851 RepID=UPI0035CA9588
MAKQAADTLGLDGVYLDPLWRITTELTPLEHELLGCWWVRRLGFVAHAGAAAITTTQTYSRLEHSLGVLALTARFAPDDAVARASALLHDIGHLPFSHTFESIAGADHHRLDHHRLGRDRLAELDPVLRRHGLSADAILARETEDAARLRSRHQLGLDHLDSFLRSGQAHGRTTEPPAETLNRLRLVDGGIDTDGDTADFLAALIAAEALAQCSPANVAPHAVLRDVAATLLEGARENAGEDAREEVTRIASMTDDQFWALALSNPRTAATTERLRRMPGSWAVHQLDPGDPDQRGGPGDPGSRAPWGLEYRIERLYVDLPTVDGQDAPPLQGLPTLPIRYRVSARLGFLDGQGRLPEDFDRMDQPTIAALVDGDPPRTDHPTAFRSAPLG